MQTQQGLFDGPNAGGPTAPNNIAESTQLWEAIDGREHLNYSH